jgi:hypothetical protein
MSIILRFFSLIFAKQEVQSPEGNATMPKDRLFLLPVILIIMVFCAQAKTYSGPTLYIAADNLKMVDAEAIKLPESTRTKIVIATHGWFEFELWPKNLTLAIRDKVDSNEWVCGLLDWQNESRVINPRDAAQYARDKAGPLLAQQILKLSKNPEHVHLIGHSAGCWVISEAAKAIAKQTHASIHLTFLDAYIPLGWDSNELGNIAIEPNTVYWADQYLTQDITLNVTNCRLIHAHNVDIGDITPGIRDHRFPFYWYTATVFGKYAPKEKYAGKKLFLKSGDIEYGFARSLEAGKQNWSKSLSLPLGNEAIKIEKENKK